VATYHHGGEDSVSTLVRIEDDESDDAEFHHIDMNDTHQYGEDGFIPTVTSVDLDGDTIAMRTLDPRPETDLIGLPGEPLQRAGDALTEEQQEQLSLYQRN